MKIIVIPNEPNPNMTGRHYFISKALAKQGHEVHEIMWDLPTIMSRKQLLRHLFTSLFTRDYEYEDLHIHKIARLPLFWPYVNGWLFKYQVKKLYRRIGADIIFAESYTNETTVPKGLPFIYDLADDYAAPGDIYGSPIYKLAFRILGVRKTMAKQCRRALVVTAVSDILCDYAKQHNSNVTKLPNGVDSEVIKAVVKSVPAHTNPHSIFYVTGFGPWSRPIETMQAVMALRNKFPQIDLTLAGDGPEASKIKQFIEENDVSEFIHYLGFVSDRKKVFSLIQQSAIGLNISEKNAWRDAAHPIKVLEYSSLGKKVVSTDLEGVKALGYPNVFMFSDDDAKNSFQKVLEKALSANDKTNYQDVSAAVLSEYDWKTIIGKLVDVIGKAKATKRVLHVTPSYPPTLGGLEKVVQNLARTQCQNGDSVSVLTAAPDANSHLDDEQFPIKRLHNFVVASTKIMPSLLPELLKVDCNTIVHLHVTQAFTPEMVWLASKIKKFRYIAHIHLDVPRSTAFGIFLEAYKSLSLKYVLRSAAYVVVFTQGQRQALHRRYGVSLDRIKVVPNGVEEQFFFGDSRQMRKMPQLLFVGRLGYQKNLSLLLDALDGVSHEFNTVLVGDGEQRQELQQKAQQLKLKNIVFTGRADGDALATYYRNADIFVLPSEREGMPLVILEAMAMGLPIVATDVIGTQDVVVNGKNGLLVSLDDTIAFRAALQKIKDDSKLFSSLSKESHRMASQYSWPKIAEQFNGLYEEANA